MMIFSYLLRIQEHLQVCLVLKICFLIWGAYFILLGLSQVLGNLIAQRPYHVNASLALVVLSLSVAPSYITRSLKIREKCVLSQF